MHYALNPHLPYTQANTTASTAMLIKITLRSCIQHNKNGKMSPWREKTMEKWIRMIELATLNKVFSRKACKYYFFDKLNICIQANDTHFMIVDMSTNETWKINIRCSISFTMCYKYNAIFFASYYEHNTRKNGKMGYYVLELKGKTYNEVKSSLGDEFISVFLHQDEENIIIFGSRGKIFTLNITNLEMNELIDLDRLNLEGCYCSNPETNERWFYLPGSWYSINDKIFEYSSILYLEKNTRLCVNLATMDVTYITGTNSPESNRFSDTTLLHHFKKLDIFAYWTNKKLLVSGTILFPNVTFSEIDGKVTANEDKEFGLTFDTDIDYKSIIYFFKKTNGESFYFEITNERKDSFACQGILKPFGNKYGVIASDVALYLIDLKEKKIKTCRMAKKKIDNFYVYEKENLIIPTYLDKISKYAYTIDDFIDCDIEIFEIKTCSHNH